MTPGKWIFVPIEKQEQITNWFSKYYYNPEADLEDTLFAATNIGKILGLSESLKT